MVGYTNISIFRPGDFCYIVLYSVRLPDCQEKPDFLEGRITDVDQPPMPKSASDPLWRFWKGRSRDIRTISAIVTADPRKTQDDVVDPVEIYQEPHKDYLVIAPAEHEDYLCRIIERQRQMYEIQRARIQALERRLEKFMGPHLATGSSQNI